MDNIMGAAHYGGGNTIMDFMALAGGMMLGGTLGVACMGIMHQHRKKVYKRSRVVF